MPYHDVIRRYYRSCNNFWLKYKIFADEWYLYENTTNNYNLVASGNVEGVSVFNKIRFNIFMEVGNEGKQRAVIRNL